MPASSVRGATRSALPMARCVSCAPTASPPRVWDEIEQVKTRIEKGEVQVPYVADAAQVRALMTDVQAPAPR